MAKCGKCKADIEFYKTLKTGKLMPIDPIATDNGNLILVDVDGEIRVASAPPLAIDDDGVANTAEDNPYRPKRYTSHFATCSAAEFYRKKGIK